MKNTKIFRQLNDEEYQCFKNVLMVIKNEKEITLDNLRIGVQEDEEIKIVLREIDDKHLNEL